MQAVYVSTQLSKPALQPTPLASIANAGHTQTATTVHIATVHIATLRWAVFFCLAFAAILLGLWPAQSHAQVNPPTPAIAQGAAWLQAQIQASGDIQGQTSSGAQAWQVQSEVARTLHALDHSVPQALRQRLTGAAGPGTEATEILARAALAHQHSGNPNAALHTRIADMAGSPQLARPSAPQLAHSAWGGRCRTPPQHPRYRLGLAGFAGRCHPPQRQ